MKMKKRNEFSFFPFLYFYWNEKIAFGFLFVVIFDWKKAWSLRGALWKKIYLDGYAPDVLETIADPLAKEGIVEGGGYFGPLVGGWRQWENKGRKKEENDFNQNRNTKFYCQSIMGGNSCWCLKWLGPFLVKREEKEKRKVSISVTTLVETTWFGKISLLCWCLA